MKRATDRESVAHFPLVALTLFWFQNTLVLLLE